MKKGVLGEQCALKGASTVRRGGVGVLGKTKTWPLTRLARKGVASGRPGLPARGDREGVRGVTRHDQALCEAATRDGNGQPQSHPGTTAQEVGPTASRPGGAAASS